MAWITSENNGQTLLHPTRKETRKKNCFVIYDPLLPLVFTCSLPSIAYSAARNSSPFPTARYRADSSRTWSLHV